MDLVLLGGMSPHNKEWIYQVEQALSPLFNTCIVHEYAHWASAAPMIDVEHELNVLRTKIRDLEHYVIFAKSAGVVLSLKGIAENVLHPNACLFVGTPLSFARDHGHQLDLWLKHLTVPTTFVQNAHDPAGSFQELHRLLRDHMESPRYSLTELPGETHDYDNLWQLHELAAKLIT
jgi:hypothetical protein